MRSGKFIREFTSLVLIITILVGFLFGAIGAYDYDYGCTNNCVDVCKRERIVDYFPATVIGCELFKKRFK